MLLSCPNCGTVTEVADVLIPSARLTATCAGCGGRIGGTVPARLDGGRSGGRGAEGGRPLGGRPAETRRGDGGRSTTRSRRDRRAAGARRSDGGRGSARSQGPAGARRAEEPGPGGAQGPQERAARHNDRGAREADESAARAGRGVEPADSCAVSEEKSLRAVARGLDPERLAKLVASDILLYNREKIRRSAEEGRLLSSMASEIVEAWDFYKKRVGDQTALGTAYFRDALNGIAEDGDPII